MGVINKIREKTGLVIGLVAFSLILFLLGADFFSPTTGILGAKDADVVAEIDGEEIKLEEYQNEIEKITYNYQLNTQSAPDEKAKESIKQQAWTNFINEIAYRNQYNELGIAVSNDELTDMVQGANISPEVRNAFTNPQTNQFDKERVIQTLQSIAQAPEEQQVTWNEFEKSILKNRERTKYLSLLTTTNYVTAAEAEMEGRKSGQQASIKYAYVPFHTIHDSTVTITDSELKAYLSEHSKEYQKEASRDIKYVTFPVKATSEDVAALREEMLDLKEGFKSAANDSIFAAVNSDDDNYYTAYTGDNLPPSLKSEDLNTGSTYGPYRVGDAHYLYKVIDINNDGEPSARASHILFKWDSEDEKASTKKEAREILRKIRNGADFSEMARIHGTDGTATRGGDLGYFGKGRMVPEFEEAVFNAKKEGLLKDVVETQFGYHIIDVTSVKSNKQFIVASIKQEIYPSDDTQDEIFRKAELFASEYTTLSQMIEGAKKEGLSVKEAKNVTSTSQNIQGLSNSRGIVTWMFRDAELNQTSEVFDIDNQYVFVALSGVQEEGTASLSAVRSEIERKVKNAKKAEVIKQKLSAVSGSIEEIASGYGKNAQSGEMSGLSLSSNSINTVGFAPAVVGKVFALNEGEKSEAIATDNGVVIVEVLSKTSPTEISDTEIYKTQLESQRKNTTAFGMNSVIEDFAEIEDKRYKFF